LPSFGGIGARHRGAPVRGTAIAGMTFMHQKKHATAERDRAPQRYDRPGHLHPDYAARLRARSNAGQEEADDREFLGADTEEELARRLGKTAVARMTGVDEVLTNELGAPAREEADRPFGPTAMNEDWSEDVEIPDPFELQEPDTAKAPDLQRRADREQVDVANLPESVQQRADREQVSGEEVGRRKVDRGQVGQKREFRPLRALRGLRSRARRYLPQAKRLAAWLGKRWVDGVNTFMRVASRKPG